MRGSGPVFTGVLRFSSCLDLTIASSTFAIKIVRAGMKRGFPVIHAYRVSRVNIRTCIRVDFVSSTRIRAAVFSLPLPPSLLPPSPLSDTIYQRLTAARVSSHGKRRKNSHYARVSVYILAQAHPRTCTHESRNAGGESERDA